MQTLRVDLTSTLAYWTVVDEAWQPVRVADAFLRHLRLGVDRAEGTTRSYAGDLAMFLGWCEAIHRDLEAGLRALGSFVGCCAQHRWSGEARVSGGCEAPGASTTCSSPFESWPSTRWPAERWTPRCSGCSTRSPTIVTCRPSSDLRDRACVTWPVPVTANGNVGLAHSPVAKRMWRRCCRWLAPGGTDSCSCCCGSAGCASARRWGCAELTFTSWARRCRWGAGCRVRTGVAASGGSDVARQGDGWQDAGPVLGTQWQNGPHDDR